MSLDKIIPLARPDLIEDDIENVSQVLRSGNLVQGEKVSIFETEAARFLGMKHAIAVANGTASLHLALLALGIGPGDDVIVPAFSFVATANVVELIGANCIFVDILKCDFNIDFEAIENAVSSSTKAIIVVHEFGLCCDIHKIVEFGHRRGIAVIEDAACAFGATENGRYAGTLGTIGSFSFHPRKALTSGEGGLIVTNNDKLAEYAIINRNHGAGPIENGFLDYVSAGFNYRMTDIQAALLIGQLARLNVLLGRRAELADLYNRALISHRTITPPSTFTHKTHVWQTYHILLDERVDRDEFASRARHMGVGCGLGAQCIPEQLYYKNKYKLSARSDFPNAYFSWRQGLALPMYSGLSKSQAQIVLNVIDQI